MKSRGLQLTVDPNKDSQQPCQTKPSLLKNFLRMVQIFELLMQ